MSCQYCHSAFVEEFLYNHPNFGPNRSMGLGNHLSDEQSRRLTNAAFMLRIFENQLRDELEQIQNVFDNVSSSQKPKSLSASQLESITDVNLTIDLICSQPSCPICSEDYSVGEHVCKLPCEHIFHRSCVIPWIEMKRTCPVS